MNYTVYDLNFSAVDIDSILCSLFKDVDEEGMFIEIFSFKIPTSYI